MIQTHVFSDTDFVTKSIDSGCALEAGYNFPGWNPACSVVIYLCIMPKEPNKTPNLLQNKLTSLHLHRHTDRHTLMNLTSLGLFFLHQDFCFLPFRAQRPSGRGGAPWGASTHPHVFIYGCLEGSSVQATLGSTVSTPFPLFKNWSIFAINISTFKTRSPRPWSL